MPPRQSCARSLHLSTLNLLWLQGSKIPDEHCKDTALLSHCVRAALSAGMSTKYAGYHYCLTIVQHPVSLWTSPSFEAVGNSVEDHQAHHPLILPQAPCLCMAHAK